MTDANAVLHALGRRLADAYVKYTEPTAVLLSGSTSLNAADFYSDLDLIVYHQSLPDNEPLGRAREAVGAQGFRWLIERTDTFIAEVYRVDGVECEVGHGTVAEFERTIAEVRSGRDPATRGHKALGGLLNGIPLYGTEQIAAWQAQACDFPEALARGIVDHYLRHIFPIWYIADAMPSRDGELWVRHTLTEIAFSVLGILAGLNRRYYSAFQFKRMHDFVGTLAIRPPDLAERLSLVAGGPQPTAIEQAESLVGDTLGLIARHLPECDTSTLRRKPGERQQPWR